MMMVVGAGLMLIGIIVGILLALTLSGDEDWADDGL